MAAETKKVIIVLADVSGYTKFMLANQHDEAKSEIVIGQIINELIEATELPLRVAKIEGDAVFLYAVHSGREAEWEADKEKIGATIHRFFSLFASELVRLSKSKLCTCNNCRNLNKLKLKVIIHAGEAVFDTIKGYEELAGLDIILAHLLLKNSLTIDHYILVTDAAYRQLRFPATETHFKHTERYTGFGVVHTHVFVPADPIDCPADGSHS